MLCENWLENLEHCLFKRLCVRSVSETVLHCVQENPLFVFFCIAQRMFKFTQKLQGMYQRNTEKRSASRHQRIFRLLHIPTAQCAGSQSVECNARESVKEEIWRRRRAMWMQYWIVDFLNQLCHQIVAHVTPDSCQRESQTFEAQILTFQFSNHKNNFYMLKFLNICLWLYWLVIMMQNKTVFANFIILFYIFA